MPKLKDNTVKMPEFRPQCGFCKRDFKSLEQVIAHPVRLDENVVIMYSLCPFCGSVLGVNYVLAPEPEPMIMTPN